MSVGANDDSPYIEGSDRTLSIDSPIKEHNLRDHSSNSLLDFQSQDVYKQFVTEPETELQKDISRVKSKTKK